MMLSDRERFALYIAWRRLRTEMWRSFPLMVFARWLVPRLARALERVG